MSEEEQNLREDELYEHYHIIAEPKQTLIRVDKFLRMLVSLTPFGIC